MIGVGGVVAAMGLSDQSVEAEEHTAAADGEGIEDASSERGGADGERGVGHAADHDGVDDGHEHPAEFAEDERPRETENGGEL